MSDTLNKPGSLEISVCEMNMCLSYAMDLVSPVVVDHHRKVAYIALKLSEELCLPPGDRDDLILAAMVHDIGAFSARERLSSLEFEQESAVAHAENGYHLISTFGPLSHIAPIVRYHHLPWLHGAGAKAHGEGVPILSQVLHLADRVAALIRRDREILDQSPEITERILRNAGRLFVPEFAEAFRRIAGREYFWLDLTSSFGWDVITRRSEVGSLTVRTEEFIPFARLFAKIIDFKSPFTATHSGGVASCAGALARKAGFSEEEVKLMRVAGYIHDLGKLSVPVEILEKNGPLTLSESNIVKKHPYNTYHLIRHVRGLNLVNEWASNHHECLDGSGYPFHHTAERLSMGSRIMAVADIFTALTEDRPYRKGMTRNGTLQVLASMTARGKIDSDIVSLLSENFGYINDVRTDAQAEAHLEYNDFMKVIVRP